MYVYISSLSGWWLVASAVVVESSGLFGSLKEIGSWRIPLESGTCEGSRLDPGVVVRESLSSFGFDPFEIAIEVT